MENEPLAIVMLGIATSGATIIGAVLIVLQLRQTHLWNRRIATQTACNEFNSPHIYEHWKAFRKRVALGPVSHGSLNPDEEASVMVLLSYFETIGLLVKHNILDEELVFDCFGSLVPKLAESFDDCVQSFRKERNDKRVYERFSEMAMRFAIRSRKLKPTLVEVGSAAA